MGNLRLYKEQASIGASAEITPFTPQIVLDGDHYVYMQVILSVL